MTMEFWPAVLAGDLTLVGATVAKGCAISTAAAQLSDDPAERCKIHCYSNVLQQLFLGILTQQPGFDWDETFGKEGQIIHEMEEAYDFDTMHRHITEVTSTDFVGLGVCSCTPLLFHWGDIKRANEYATRALTQFKSVFNDPEARAQEQGISVPFTFFHWPATLHLLNRDNEGVALMTESAFDPENMDKTMDWVSQACGPVMQARDQPMERQLLNQDAWAAQMCAHFALLSGDATALDRLSMPAADYTLLNVVACPLNLAVWHGQSGSIVWPT